MMREYEVRVHQLTLNVHFAHNEMQTYRIYQPNEQ